MSFASPLMLLSLLLVPLLAAGYVRITRRRDAAAERTGMRLSEAASGRRAGRRRHVPAAIFLVAVALLLVSLGRPRVVLALPHMEGTVVLAFDVSTSMTADDLKPSRIDAAKRAASKFVRKQPSTVKTGVVAFSDAALVIQQPTDVREDVLAAIDRLGPQGGTSLSEGMFASLGAIAGRSLAIPDDVSEEDLASMDIGYFGNAVIVLLSDGEHLSRANPLAVAELASGAGVRVFPIGVGTPEGTTLEVDGYHIATTLNELLLQEIASTTDGTYFRAEDEAQLAEIYEKIDLKLTTKGKDTEVTAVFAGAAMALLLVGAGLTLRWFGRVP